jgi:hypothetical protein
MVENENGGTLPGNRGSARGLQPRVVLGLLLGGSLAGIWIAHVGSHLRSRIVTWVFVVSLGVLVGGLYWRIALFDGDAFEDDAHCQYVRDRWERIEAGAVWGAVLSGIASLGFGMGNDPSGIGTLVHGSGLACASALWIGLRWYTDTSIRRKLELRSGLLFVALVSVGGFAWLETGTSFLDWIVQVAHVGAFSLWIGGATWHNFVVLPTMRTRPNAAKSVKSQARSFRRYLPAVIVLLVVTGLYQTDRLVGFTSPTLLGSWVGHLIVFKLFVLTLVNYPCLLSRPRRLL